MVTMSLSTQAIGGFTALSGIVGAVGALAKSSMAIKAGTALSSAFWGITGAEMFKTGMTATVATASSVIPAFATVTAIGMVLYGLGQAGVLMNQSKNVMPEGVAP